MKLYRLLRNFRHMSMKAYRCHLMAGIGRHWEVMMGYKGEWGEHGNIAKLWGILQAVG
jgi:hypothetical protein